MTSDPRQADSNTMTDTYLDCPACGASIRARMPDPAVVLVDTASDTTVELVARTIHASEYCMHLDEVTDDAALDLGTAKVVLAALRGAGT